MKVPVYIIIQQERQREQQRRRDEELCRLPLMPESVPEPETDKGPNGEQERRVIEIEM